MGVVTETAIRRNDIARNLRATETDCVCSTSYATGGETLTAAQLGLQGVLFAWGSIKVPDSDNTVSVYITRTTATALLLKVNIGTAEATSTTNLAGLTVSVVALGY